VERTHREYTPRFRSNHSLFFLSFPLRFLFDPKKLDSQAPSTENSPPIPKLQHAVLWEHHTTETQESEGSPKTSKSFPVSNTRQGYSLSFPFLSFPSLLSRFPFFLFASFCFFFFLFLVFYFRPFPSHPTQRFTLRVDDNMELTKQKKQKQPPRTSQLTLSRSLSAKEAFFCFHR